MDFGLREAKEKRLVPFFDPDDCAWQAADEAGWIIDSCGVD
jgi:hypothetical protein